MDLAAEIRHQVRRYLTNEIPVSSLWRWTQEHFWDVDNHDSPETARLAHDVELLLFETAHGDWTEDELREKLRPVISVYEFTLGGPSIRPMMSTGPGQTLIIRPSRILQPA